MPPFLKFPHDLEGANGPESTLRFVNTAFISDAIYHKAGKTLSFTVVSHNRSETIHLEGKVAKDALAILQSLNAPELRPE